jgi:hypothetical protein
VIVSFVILSLKEAAGQLGRLHSTRAADHGSSPARASLPPAILVLPEVSSRMEHAGGLRRSIAITKGEIEWESSQRTLNLWKTC